MITKSQRKNAERIVELDRHFGHLLINDTQTVREVNNLSIPCATLVCFGIVTGVADTYDGVNDRAVENVAGYCAEAVKRLRNVKTPDWLDESVRVTGLDVDGELARLAREAAEWAAISARQNATV